MEFEKRLQTLTQLLEQTTREAILQENVLQGVRQRVAEIQGRLNILQEIIGEEKEIKEVRKNAPEKTTGQITSQPNVLDEKEKPKRVRKNAPGKP